MSLVKVKGGGGRFRGSEQRGSFQGFRAVLILYFSGNVKVVQATFCNQHGEPLPPPDNIVFAAYKE